MSNNKDGSSSFNPFNNITQQNQWGNAPTNSTHSAWGNQNNNATYNPNMNQLVADNATKFFSGAPNTQTAHTSQPNYQNQLYPNNPMGSTTTHTSGNEPQARSVSTSLGLVKIVSLSTPIPAGWRVLTYQQGQNLKQQLITILNEWSIVAFDHGKLDGQGYGHRFIPEYGNECGERFIVRIN